MRHGIANHAEIERNTIDANWTVDKPKIDVSVASPRSAVSAKKRE